MTRIERARAIVARNTNLIIDLTADYASDLRAEIVAHYHKIPGYVNVIGLVHGPVHAVDGLVNLHVWGTGKDEGE